MQYLKTTGFICNIFFENDFLKNEQRKTLVIPPKQKFLKKAL